MHVKTHPGNCIAGLSFGRVSLLSSRGLVSFTSFVSTAGSGTGSFPLLKSQSPLYQQEELLSSEGVHYLHLVAQ